MGLDLGTTSVKAVLIDENGNIIAEVQEHYPLDKPVENAAEQDPETWWSASCKTIKNLLQQTGVPPENIEGLGLAGQMHSAVFLNDQHQPIRPAITWADNRANLETKDLEEIIGRDTLLNITNNRSLPGFTAPKVLWLKRNESTNFRKVDKLTLPKDYLRYRLTGNLRAEKAGASATLLFDLEKEEWSESLLKSVGLSKSQVPSLTESKSVAGTVTTDVAKRTGLLEGTPVVAGAGDQQAGALGIGAINPGTVVSTIGTGGQVFTTSRELVRPKDGRIHVFRQCLPGRWHVMGAMQSAGLALRWFNENIVGKMSDKEFSYEELSKVASQAPPGSGSLMFLPYLTGERSPHMDPDARGCFIGLNLDHEFPHLVRSIMEGVVFGMKDSLEILEEMDLLIREIRCAGGGATSSLWRQIQADVYQQAVIQTNIKENAAFGAALLAGIGLEIFPFPPEDVSKKFLKIRNRTEPQRENLHIYEKMHERYQSLYRSLREEFRGLANI